MNKELIAEINDIANELIPGLAVFTIKKMEGVSAFAYNEIQAETQKLLERVRTNEGLEAFLMRKDSKDAMCLELGFSHHDQMGAIVRELAQKVTSVSKKYGIDSVQIRVDQGASEAMDAAYKLKKAAQLLEIEFME